MSHTTTSFPLRPFGQCSMPKGAGITTHFSTLSVEGEFASTPEGKKFYKRKIEMIQHLNVQEAGAGGEVNDDTSKESKQLLAEEDKGVKSFPFAHADWCIAEHGVYDRAEVLSKVKGTMYEMPRPASCVVLVTPQGKVLLTQRAAHMRTFSNAWVCPGGGVDDAETFEEGAVREVREEVGLTVTKDQLNFLGCWESTYRPEETDEIPTRHHIIAFYVCFVPDESSMELQEEECQAAVWIPFPSLPECAFHLTARTADSQRAPLTGLPEGSKVSQGQYFFICEAGRRFHEGTLKVPPAKGAGTRYE